MNILVSAFKTLSIFTSSTVAFKQFPWFSMLSLTSPLSSFVSFFLSFLFYILFDKVVLIMMFSNIIFLTTGLVATFWNTSCSLFNVFIFVYRVSVVIVRDGCSGGCGGDWWWRYISGRLITCMNLSFLGIDPWASQADIQTTCNKNRWTSQGNNGLA